MKKSYPLAFSWELNNKTLMSKSVKKQKKTVRIQVDNGVTNRGT